MKTKTIELYEFDELPEDVRAKVLEKERDINVDYGGWNEFTLDEWVGKLEAMGFENPEIVFSGFYSQGDGASFTCKHMQVETFIKAQQVKGRFKNILKALADFSDAEVLASVDRISHQYSHENTVRGSVEVLLYNGQSYGEKFIEKVEAEGRELESLITETVRKLSKQIYRDLEAEYNGLTDDEAVIDTIRANEYTFTASGKMENLS